MSAEAARSTRLWTVSVVSFSPSSNGSRLATIVESVRAIRAACRSRISRPISGSRSSEPVELQPDALVLQRPAGQEDAERDQPSSSAHHQSARKSDRPITIRVSKRQLLADILELLDHLGHDEDHQREDDEGGDDREHDRIGQRRQHLAAHLRLPLEQVGEPLEDLRQRARALAGRDHRPVERREARRLARHRVGQPPALDHAGMDRCRARAAPPPARPGATMVRSASSSGLTWTRVASWRVNRVSCLAAQLLAREAARATARAAPRASVARLDPDDVEPARARAASRAASAVSARTEPRRSRPAVSSPT